MRGIGFEISVGLYIMQLKAIYGIVMAQWSNTNTLMAYMFLLETIYNL